MTLFGYEFRNEALLEEALTMPSCKQDRPGVRDNQRLEFLGDAVLGLLAADRLYATHPEDGEGPLTVRRIHMVSAAALCEAADRVGLVPLLHRNRGAEALSKSAKSVADAVEAVIGAAWLDGGLAAAKAVFEALDLPAKGAAPAALDDNPKGALQIRAQAMKPPRHPQYELLKVAGKSHAPRFTVRVTVEGVGRAEGEAGSRQGAETLAAQRLLSAWSAGTGKMPVPQLCCRHGQDARATRESIRGTGILPVPREKAGVCGTGILPVPRRKRS